MLFVMSVKKVKILSYPQAFLLSCLTIPSNLPHTSCQEIHDVHFRWISGMSFLISLVAPVQASISFQLNKFLPPPPLQHAVFLIQQPKFFDKASRLRHFHTRSSEVLQSSSPTTTSPFLLYPSPQISVDADAD